MRGLPTTNYWKRGYTVGSVQQLPSGRWKARLRTVPDKCRTFDTQADALAWLPVVNRSSRGRRRTRSEVIDHLAANFVVDESGCWFWMGGLTNEGYGRMSWQHENGVNVPGAHRVVMHAIGQRVPRELVIDHLCRNRHCVNPDHLEAVAQRENVLRSPIAQGALNAGKTHCPSGHPYSPENTYTYVMKPPRSCTTRVCRTCQKAYSDRLRAKRMGAVV